MLGWLPGAQQSVISANRGALEEWLITSRLEARKVGATLRGRFEYITCESNEQNDISATSSSTSSATSSSSSNIRVVGVSNYHRTFSLRFVEKQLGFGVWKSFETVGIEPMVRHVLKHAAMPEMETSSSSTSSSKDNYSNEQNVNNQSSSSVRCDDLSSESASQVMEDLVHSLGTLDHASHVHATRSPKLVYV